MLLKTKMTHKNKFILGLLTILSSCNPLVEKKDNIEVEDFGDTLVETDSINRTSEEQKDSSYISSYQLELNKALKDPKVDNYYKEIYLKEKLILTDDNKMLSITDSLFTTDLTKDLFYFIVFTKSMNSPDGFYSEALGLSAMDFVTKKTEWFADYFSVAPKLTEQDLNNWAEYISGEIKISSENHEQKAVNKLEKELLKNIRLSRQEYEVVIKKLVERIRNTTP